MQPRGHDPECVFCRRSERTTAALREVIRCHPGATAVMVGHDSVNRALLLYALGLPLSRYWHIRHSPCAINEIDRDDDAFVIGGVDRTGHLIGS